MIRDVKEFCKKYEAYVTESSRMQHRVKRANFAAWNDPEIYQQIPYQAVKCVEVTMPEDRFRALLEHDEWLYKMQMGTFVVGDEGAHIVRQHEQEVRLRHQHPGVMEAWQQYQTMLQLVR